MPTPQRHVAVYCGSSEIAPECYYRAAEDLGEALARAGFGLVYGGGNLGLMGRLADAVHRHGGRVHGVITHKLVALEQARRACDELEIVDSMRQRKQRMEELASAFIALPGGLGTFEEFFEILVARLLEYHARPIVLVNVNRYFDALLALFERGTAEGFIPEGVHRLIRLVETPEQAVASLINADAP